MKNQNESSRIKGAVQELGGKVKEGFGHLVGNERLEAEGHAQAAAGQAQQDSAKAGERRKGFLEEKVGVAKGAVGALIEDPKMRAEGKVAELTGQARQKLNQ